MFRSTDIRDQRASGRRGKIGCWRCSCAAKWWARGEVAPIRDQAAGRPRPAGSDRRSQRADRREQDACSRLAPALLMGDRPRTDRDEAHATGSRRRPPRRRATGFSPTKRSDRSGAGSTRSAGLSERSASCCCSPAPAAASRRGPWSEIDLEAKVWTLPKERAKNGVAHEIPLSEPALEILRALPRSRRDAARRASFQPGRPPAASAASPG